MPHKRLVIVSKQDPNHMTGGQGVSLWNLAQAAALLTKQPVTHISMRLAGEPACQEYANGNVLVERLSVEDSDRLTTPYEGDEETQFRRRLEFNELAAACITQNCPPEESLIYLNGFYAVPLLARSLANYSTVSCYRLLLSKRIERTGELEPFADTIRAYEADSFRANRCIQLCSRGMQEELLSLLPAEERSAIRRRVRIVPNGIEEELFTVPALAPVTPKRIVAWGRVAPEKGFEYLIRAMEYLPDVELVLFGRVDDLERQRWEYRMLLEELADANPRVHLKWDAHGVRGPQKIALIDSAELVVVPSVYEPFGLVIGEALARGKPVIATATMGAWEMLQGEGASGTAGKLLPLYAGGLEPVNPEELAQAIRYLLDNREEREALGRKGRLRAEKFRWQNITERVLNLFSGQEQTSSRYSAPEGLAL